MELSDNLLIINYWINIIPDMLQKKCREIFTMSNQICEVHVCGESEGKNMRHLIYDFWIFENGSKW